MPDLRGGAALGRRVLLRYRRTLSALLAGLSVLLVVQTVAPAEEVTVGVVVAARDLAAGTRLSGSDVRIEQLPPELVPRGSARAVSTVAGQVVAGAMRAGEPLTDRRVLGRALLTGLPAGLVAAPVRIQDAAAAALLQPGDVIAVYAAAGGGASYATVVVERTRVITVPAADEDAQQGGLVVLAVTGSQAAALAQAAATAPLSLALAR